MQETDNELLRYADEILKSVEMLRVEQGEQLAEIRSIRGFVKALVEKYVPT